MTPVEAISITLSLVSLGIASFAAWRAYQLAHTQLRLANRNEFQRMLIDLDKELIANPRLWAVYDSNPMPNERIEDPVEQARVEAFAYMHLNVFELVYSFFNDPGDLTRVERGAWQQWDAHLRVFLKGSSLAQTLMHSPDVAEMYAPSFVKHVRSHVDELQSLTREPSEERAPSPHMDTES